MNINKDFIKKIYKAFDFKEGEEEKLFSLIREDIQLYYGFYESNIRVEWKKETSMRNLLEWFVIYRSLQDFILLLKKDPSLLNFPLEEIFLKENKAELERNIRLTFTILEEKSTDFLKYGIFQKWRNSFSTTLLRKEIEKLADLKIKELSHENIEYLVGNVISEELRISC